MHYIRIRTHQKRVYLKKIARVFSHGSGRSVVFQRPRCSFPGVTRREECISSSNETSVFATIFFEITTSWTDPLVQLNGFVTNSFCDLAPPNESHGRKKRTQNPFSRNEFTDFEQFAIEHTAALKTILASSLAQRPGTGITLQLSALRVT